MDQKVDVHAANLGVRPLPNLETRLVAADTLIPLPKPKRRQVGLFDDTEALREHDRLKRELERVRHEHFSARDPRSKRHWREEDHRVREALGDLLARTGMPAEAARAMAAWDPYDQNSFAPFFDPEWMFGIPVGKVQLQGKAAVTLLGNLALINEGGGQTELIASAPREIDSGFDIVIGNPPYIRIQTLKQKDPNVVAFYKEHYASAAKGNYDIYVVFIEAGLRLLKVDGHLAYICPHKFFNAQYGEPIREVISNGTYLRHVVHFGDQQVFAGATIYTCLLFLARGGVSDCRFVQADNFSAWRDALAGTEGRFPASSITGKEWNFAVGRGGEVFRRLMEMTQKLADVAPRIYQGPITSADSVFLFKDYLEGDCSKKTVTVTSKQLGTEVALERDILKAVVRSGDIGRNWAKSTALVLFPYEVVGTDARLFEPSKLRKSYPLAWRYLEANRHVLRSRENGALGYPLRSR